LLVKRREKFDLVSFSINSDTVVHGSRGSDVFRKRRRRAYIQSRTGIFLHLVSRGKRRSITDALRPD
jgi:hypothetical protein